MYSITFSCRISIKGTRENVSVHKGICKQRKNIEPLHGTEGLKISDPNICDFIKQENVVDRKIIAEDKKKRQSTLHSHHVGGLLLGVRNLLLQQSNAC